jgi:hypothetical protein
VALPPEALAQLRALAAQLCEIGDVWWLPSVHVQWFPGGKDRFVLVAGIEVPTGGGPQIAHLVAGSTSASSSPVPVKVPAGQAGLARAADAGNDMAMAMLAVILRELGDNEAARTN